MVRPAAILAAADPAARALRAGRYPWYDPAADDARSVLRRPWWDFNWPWTWPSWTSNSGGGGGGRGWSLDYNFGDLIVIGLVVLALSFLLVLLLESYRRYRPTPVDAEVSPGVAIDPGRIEGLPEDVRPRSADPWAEAERLRASGEYAGAVVNVFAYQLLVLDRLGQVRLGPGRTGRQLVRMVGDADLRKLVAPTLRLFEASRYGHRTPDGPDFEQAWGDALEFRRRAAGEVES